MKTNNLISYVLIASASMQLLSGCGKSASSGGGTSTVPTNSEVAASVVSGQVQNTESNSLAQVEPDPRSSFRKFADLAQSSMMPWAEAATCSTFACGAAACTGSGTPWTLGYCSPLWNLLAKWNGTWTFNFNSGAACSSAKSSGLLSTGASNYFDLTSTSGVTRTSASSFYVTTDSNASGYSSTVSGGARVTCGGSGCATSRAITINGLHRALYGPFGTQYLDHSINTTSDLAVSLSGASRTVTAGTVVLQHNLAHYTATSTISSTLSFNNSCCHPIGGTITTTFAGGPLNGQTESIVFGATCGTATVNGSAVTLDYCM